MNATFYFWCHVRPLFGEDGHLQIVFPFQFFRRCRALRGTSAVWGAIAGPSPGLRLKSTDLKHLVASSGLAYFGMVASWGGRLDSPNCDMA